VVTAGLIAASIVVLDVANIAKLASAFQLLLFSLLNAAVVIMRESGIEGYDPGYRSPFYPWVQIVGFLTPFWLIAEMGELAILFSLGLVAVTLGWFFHYAHGRVERSGAIFHTFARLGARRHAGLDLELRGIVKEKGLREEDPFDEVVARAAVLDLRVPAPIEEVAALAARILGRRTGANPADLEAGFIAEVESGFVPVAKGAALPHLRVPGLERPAMLLLRSREGLRSSSLDGAHANLSDVRAMFFLVSPEEEPGQHLRLLGHLATHVDDPGFMDRWLAATDETEVKETLLREDRSVTLRVGATPGTAAWVGRTIGSLDLPDGILVALVRRGRGGIVPRGSTTLRDGDRLTVIGDREVIRELLRANGREEAAVPT
jgi:APA family basic amino acid/polyamine antiporter